MRVLLATDGSTWAGHALATVAGSFAADRVDVLVLAAVAPDQSETPKHLDDAVRALRAAGFSTSALARPGHPAEVILRAADEHHCDLIAMGKRGLSGAARLFAGSVSSNVVRHSAIPVLIAVEGRPIRRIVLGYDGSPDADACLDVVATLPLRTDADVVVVTAFDASYLLQSGIAPTMHDAAGTAYEEDLRQAEIHARVTADRGCHELTAARLQASALVRRGHPADIVSAATDEVDADLIAVGSRGLSGIRRFFLGSTSAALLGHPERNVLVVKHRELAEPS